MDTKKDKWRNENNYKNEKWMLSMKLSGKFFPLPVDRLLELFVKEFELDFAYAKFFFRFSELFV